MQQQSLVRRAADAFKRETTLQHSTSTGSSQSRSGNRVSVQTCCFAKSG